VTHSRRTCAALAVVTIVLGLASRRYSYHLPPVLHKNAGDILWATLVYFLFGLLLPAVAYRRTAAYAALFTVVIELFKLFHTPSLDQFRKSAISKLIFGTAFSWSNLLCYGLGIVLGVVVERAVCSRIPSGSNRLSTPQKAGD
jgi:hypothetical protein